MPKPPITLTRAIHVAEMAMLLQRQTYKFDSYMYEHGFCNAKTSNAKVKYDQLTEAMALLKSLVSPIVDQVAEVDTKQ